MCVTQGLSLGDSMKSVNIGKAERVLYLPTEIQRAQVNFVKSVQF